MNIIKVVPVLFCSLTGLLPISGQGMNGNDCNGVVFTNKLGVNATVAIDSFKYEVSNATANYFLNNSKGFVIQLGDNTYLSIPICSFQDANLKAGEHTVTLTTGEMVKGKLIGSFTSSGKIYNLDSITSIRAIKHFDYLKQNRQNTTWTLSFVYPNLPALIITEPQFGNEYPQTYKKSDGIFYTWEMGSAYRASEHFSIKYGLDEIAANLTDFAEVSLTPNNDRELPSMAGYSSSDGAMNWIDHNGDKKACTIELKSENGITTKGSLILKDSDGSWAFFARVPKWGDSSLVIVKPHLVLKENARE